MLTHFDLEKDYPRYPALDNISLSVEEEQMWVDLSPYAGTEALLLRMLSKDVIVLNYDDVQAYRLLFPKFAP